MLIRNLIRINNYDYYVHIDTKYIKKDNDIRLVINNNQDDYFDSGDLRILLEKISDNYSNNYKKYTYSTSPLLDDCLYIYKYVPFICGIECVSISNKNNKVYTTSYLSKEELDEYVSSNNIKLDRNTNFKLYDARTWNI